METDDTLTGGEELSIEQAAAAFAKANTKEAKTGQSEDDLQELDADENADEDLTESDEEEVEDEDGDPDEEEGQPEEGEDEDEPETEGGRFVASNGRVKLPDGTTATVGDLIQGNLRDRDYRQKTMDLAEQRRTFEEKSSAFQASEKQVNEQREYMVRLLESIAPQPPDPKMMEEDFVGYHQQKDNYERWQAHLHYLSQQAEASKQEVEHKTAEDRKRKETSEWEALQEKLPELRDEAKLKVFAQDIRSAALNAGYSPQEIAEHVPYDHRMALVLRKAAKWDKLQASKPKAQEKMKGKPPVNKGGKRLSSDAQKARRANDAIHRLKETGTVEDAARAYLASKG
ncbi:hypothetical protein [Mesorhizobium sp. Z1-4]|uniref:hypothetical protein n=1 Tax=Mesorhizobium sp. Z1-4 TaxID=2448478 RepID=UPI00197FCB96|nr:hypothetical protein [Mesorhizobium sp. Z1-4]